VVLARELAQGVLEPTTFSQRFSLVSAPGTRRTIRKVDEVEDKKLHGQLSGLADKVQLARRGLRTKDSGNHHLPASSLE